MEIYIHIPFCKQKCNYCDFLSAPADEKSQIKYVEKLCEEIKNYKGIELALKTQIDDKYIETYGVNGINSIQSIQLLDDKDNVSSVFIGGGTPSILPSGQIEKILKTIYDVFAVSKNAEISIECNPGTVSKEKFMEYKKAGVNRISFGLQSAIDIELKSLGRIHTYDEFLEGYRIAREIGFCNINVDLMSGLIGQKTCDFEKTLSSVIALKPEHISAYSLIIEEGTPLFEYVRKMEDKGINVRPSEDMDREIYHMTKEKLKEAGYERYEISNYARKGYECRHNLGYWQGEEYIGFGLGASSYLHIKGDAGNNEYMAVRFKNSGDLSKYCNQKEECIEEIEFLNIKDCMSEFVITGLRCMEGISKEAFAEIFNKDIMEVFGVTIGKYISLNLLKEDGDEISFTDEGIDVSNYILADFL